ncbi:MAG: NfeD family protein [Pseudomonadota bacterium]|nr:NfeD family protein [Pseudomonadota bacterium]
MVLSKREMWLLIGTETIFFAALAAWALWWLDRLLEPTAIIGALLIIVVGDIATVLLMQRFAPTKITLAIGETSHLLGKVTGGFCGNAMGTVLVRGEQWKACCKGDAEPRLGDSVKILSRTGLTLLVEIIEQENPGPLVSGSLHK